jgi:hypothetical protein
MGARVLISETWYKPSRLRLGCRDLAYSIIASARASKGWQYRPPEPRLRKTLFPLGRFAWRRWLVFGGFALLLESGLLSALLVLWLVLPALVFDYALVFLALVFLALIFLHAGQ